MSDTQDTNVLDAIQVDLAGLNDAAQHQVLDALHDDPAATLEHAQELMHQAQEAQDHLADVTQLQHDQAQAVAAGDFAHAEDLAQQAGYELHAASDDGAAVDHSIVQADHDVQALDSADWHSQIAHDDAVAADSYASAGDFHNADAYATHAEDATATAYDYGHAGDAGGTYASHDVSTDTTSHVDTSSTSE